MKPSPVGKCSVIIRGCKTSVSLEPEFRVALTTIAATRGMSFPMLVRQIAAEQEHNNLSCACRLYVLRNMALLLPALLGREPPAVVQ